MSNEEAFSWATALIIMLLFSVLGIITRILGTDPFTLEFEASILYLPTLVLILVAAVSRQRVRTTRSAGR